MKRAAQHTLRPARAHRETPFVSGTIAKNFFESRRRDTDMQMGAFRVQVMSHWKEQGRHTLPWRHTRDPYKILVSEVMLQQTRVDRVIPFYHKFIKRFPSAAKLAQASLADVLREWSGLGYNRRAKFLREAARGLAEVASGRKALPYDALRRLPGVGEYTAKAIRVFAWNEPEVLVETNIRTAFFHHFFPKARTVSDRRVAWFAAEAAQGMDPREWHWALMDYGAHLKRSGVRINQKSAHYARQSRFEGSVRQVRGAILKALLQGRPLSEVGVRHEDYYASALEALQAEGLIRKRGKGWQLVSQ